MKTPGRTECPDLQQWHRRLHRDDDEGDFPDDPVNCATDPELWQIAAQLQNEPKRYFVIRRHHPDRFAMVQISDQPRCGASGYCFRRWERSFSFSLQNISKMSESGCRS